jgi:Lipocalin-like domain
MKAGCGLLLAIAFTVGLSAQAAKKSSARERLIGAWRLVRIDASPPDPKSASGPQPASGPKSASGPQPTGMLIYTRDGHMSVQLMYPQSANTLSNEYVLNGYEASFGSYDVDEAAHTVTHHV